jgi:hypothetical protein
MTEQSGERWVYQFWMADVHGLVTVKRTEVGVCNPEIWRDGNWITGSPYVMDAITGMGEDPYSCGEYAEELSMEEAKSYAEENGIDLFVESTEEN